MWSNPEGPIGANSSGCKPKLMRSICQGFVSTGRKSYSSRCSAFQAREVPPGPQWCWWLCLLLSLPTYTPHLDKTYCFNSYFTSLLSDLENITQKKSFSIPFLDYLSIFYSICFIISSFTFNHVENIVRHSDLLFKTEAVLPQIGVLAAHSRIPLLEFPWPKEGAKAIWFQFIYNNTHFILFFNWSVADLQYKHWFVFYVNLLLFCIHIHLYYFLDSTYKWYYRVFVFLWLILFSINLYNTICQLYLN